MKDSTSTLENKTSKEDEEKFARTFDFYVQQLAKKECKNGVFIYTDEVKSVLNILRDYFLKNEQKCFENNIDLRKSIALVGNVGSGKTMIMKTLSLVTKSFKMHNANWVVDDYEDGDNVIKRLGRNAVFKVGPDKYVLHHACFDDIGKEQNARKDFKKEKNVLGEILDARYTNWVEFGLKTHSTHNLRVKENQILYPGEKVEDIPFHKRYGDRVYSRYVQMSNIIYLGATEDSIDWRLI